MILGKYKAVTLDPASLCIKRMSMVFMLWEKSTISTYCIFIVSFLMTVLFASSQGATLMLALMPWFIVLHSWAYGFPFKSELAYWVKKTKPKIKLFSNYGYLIKSAFVTAAGVVEIGVCKHLYMLICFQPQRCFCLSVFLTPGHWCKQPACLHAELHCLGKTACYPGYLHGTTSPCSLFALWGISVRRKPN